jgi:hypothetical protein
MGNPRLAAVNDMGRTTVATSILTPVAVGAGSTDRTVLETGKTRPTMLVEDRRGVGLARADP